METSWRDCDAYALLEVPLVKAQVMQLTNRLRHLARSMVGLVLLASATAHAGPLNALRSVPRMPEPADFQPFATPTEYRSEDGALFITMEAGPTSVSLGPYSIRGATFNGEYGGPVLRVKPGDTLHFRLVDHLAQNTNVQFHGLGVSPQGHGDDSMHMDKPGESWEYVIAISKEHPPGIYWYHTHGHDFAERQLMGGLSGTILIEVFQDQLPATRPLTERLIALKEFSPDGRGGLNNLPKPFSGTIQNINGQLAPVIDMQSGETQLWRLSDHTANTYFRLRLEGHRFTQVGRDARPIFHPVSIDEIVGGWRQL